MSGSNPPFNPKVDVFMPLYIGRYLADTAHLDAQKSGAYLHLIMYFWIRGPLPDDPGTLATIAKCTPDAWSIIGASVMQFFSRGPDGMLHQRGAERIKEQWIGKRLKAHEKAQKAANARWSRHRAKKGTENEQGAKPGDAPSTTQAMLEQCPTSTEEIQKQKQPPPTPSAARRGIEPQAGDAGSTPQAPQSEAKAKPAILPDAGPRANGNGRTPHPMPGSGGKGPQGGSAGHLKKRVRSEKPDPRLEPLEEELLHYWREMNPELPEYRFTASDRRALHDLLERSPSLSIAQLRRLLHNRAASDVNPSAPIYKWLRGLVEYSAGALSKYGKPAAVRSL